MTPFKDRGKELVIILLVLKQYTECRLGKERKTRNFMLYPTDGILISRGVAMQTDSVHTAGTLRCNEAAEVEMFRLPEHRMY